MSKTNTVFFRDTLAAKDHKRVSMFIEKNIGIQLPESKKVLIETRLRKRQLALEFQTLSEYLDFVLENPQGEQEQVHFIDSLTTNKTDFYREAEHFHFMRQHILSNPEYHNSHIKIWSAGCSSGEEPYTLSIEMSELKSLLPNMTFSITATDISNRCLEKAKRGVYLHDRVEVMPLALRKKYLLKSKKSEEIKVKMIPEIQAPITFQRFNLITSDWQPFVKEFNFIFCRNVMIYFNNEDRKVLTQKFHSALNRFGILMIGHSESLIDPLNQFKRLIPTVYSRDKGV